MKIEYEHNEKSAPMYHIYLDKNRRNPEDELHIWSVNISDVSKCFYESYHSRVDYSYLKCEFNKAMIRCVKKQLK